MHEVDESRGTQEVAEPATSHRRALCRAVQALSPGRRFCPRLSRAGGARDARCTTHTLTITAVEAAEGKVAECFQEALRGPNVTGGSENPPPRRHG